MNTTGGRFAPVNSSIYNSTQVLVDVTNALNLNGYNVTYPQVQEVSNDIQAVRTSAQDVVISYQSFYDSYTDFETYFLGLENDFNYFKDTFNTSIYASFVVTTFIGLFSLIWPLVIAVLVRKNLRTGRWRYNRSAYLPSYEVHTLSAVPGMFVGVIIVSFLVIATLLGITLFSIVYAPVRNFLVALFGDFVVGSIIAIVLLAILNYLMFSLDSRKNLEAHSYNNVHRFSVFFGIMLYFNLLYGLLGALIRFGYFVCYCLIAVLRIDTSILPAVLWSVDSAFSTFNAYLLYEVIL
jgi:hypothetical protein